MSNPTAGVPGNLEESRADLEYRLRRPIAENARNLDVSRQTTLLAVPGVTDAYT